MPGGTNGGIDSRDIYFTTGEVVEMEGNLRMDFGQQERYMLNGVTVNFKFYPSSDQFVLMYASGDTKGWRLKIHDMDLKICTLTINPKVILGLMVRVQILRSMS